jgi:hypothetical protein
MEVAFHFCKIFKYEVYEKAIEIGSGVINRRFDGLWMCQISPVTCQLIGALCVEGMPPVGFFRVI